VQTGGSLLLWRDYFDKATVYGIDIDPVAPIEPAAADETGTPADETGATTKIADRIEFLQRDAYTAGTVEELRALGPFDVLIDDGSHMLEHIQFFARHYTQLLAPGGALVIEDIQDQAWVADILQAFPEDVRERVRFVDRRGVKGRYDDMMLVFQLAE
jgi:demethylmacrocin O-methyltransferase